MKDTAFGGPGRYFATLSNRLRVCPYEVMHVKDPRQVERSL